VQLFPYLWPKDWDLRIRVIVSLLCLLIGKVVSVALPFAYKYAVDALSKPIDQFVFPTAAIILYGMGGFSKEYVHSRCMLTLYRLLGNFRDTIFIKVQNVAQRNAALETFSHLHSLSISYHLNRKTGGVLRGIDRGTRGINFLTSFMVCLFSPVNN
jgi:ATP-binding cassette subfamily B protein